MLYWAGAFFLLALIAIGLNLTKFEFARGAGLTSSFFLLAALACLAGAAFKAKRETEGDVAAH